MLDPLADTNILALPNMVCNSPDKFVYCPAGVVDSENLDGGTIHGLWWHDAPAESMYPIKCRGRGHNYSVSAKAVQDTHSEYFFNEGAVSWQWDLA